MTYLDTMSDEELVASWKKDSTPQELEVFEAFAERYGEKALALYPVLFNLVASAHGDCITTEGADETSEEGRCWGVPATEIDRLSRLLGIDD